MMWQNLGRQWIGLCGSLNSSLYEVVVHALKPSINLRDQRCINISYASRFVLLEKITYKGLYLVIAILKSDSHLGLESNFSPFSFVQIFLEYLMPIMDGTSLQSIQLGASIVTISTNFYRWRSTHIPRTWSALVVCYYIQFIIGVNPRILVHELLGIYTSQFLYIFSFRLPHSYRIP